MSVKCILMEQEKSQSISLQRIAITTPPTKILYQVGETFDPTGMIVTGYYGTSSAEIVKTMQITGYLINPTTITANTSQVTVSCSESGNVLFDTQSVITWEWGSETATADANWFKGLQVKVQADGADSSWVGKTKSVTLTSAVLGTTTHLIRCIGVNQDGDNTVTFQTKNCLSSYTVFGSGNSEWIGSTVRAQCQNYYNAFPGKPYIKTVKKGTNTEYNTSSVVYNDETVWIPSIYEVGFSSYQYKPVGLEYTQGCSTAYSYYSSNANRVKNESDSSSTAANWWTRSRSSGGTSGVCVVYKEGYAIYSSYDVYVAGNRLAPAFVIG